MNRIITSITLILALVFPVAMSGAPAEPAKKDWSPTEIQQLRDQVNDGRSKLFLEVMAIDRWTMDKLKESAALAESPKQIEQMLAICMDSSKRLKALTEQMPNDELRKAVSGIDATFVKALGHFLNLHKGKSKGPRDLTKTNWDVEHQNAVQEFKNIYVPLLLWNKLSLSPDESSKITSLILSLEK